MYQSINFLRERVRLQEATLRSDQRIALFTSIALGVFCTIVVAVVGYSVFLKSKLSATEQAIVAVDEKIQSLRTVESSYGQRQMILALASQVVEKRTKAWDAISYLYTLMPREAAISSINLSGSDGSLEFTVVAPTIFSFRDLSEALQSPAVTTSGYRPSLGSLSRAKDGSYSLAVRLYITKPSPSPTVQPVVPTQ